MISLSITPGQEFNVFQHHFPTWSGWQATFVINEQGQTIGQTGSSKDIGNATDLQLLLALRSKADLIFTTGETAHKEKYRASRFAPIAVLTGNPDSVLALPLFAEPGTYKNFTITPSPGTQSLGWVSRQLRELGFSRFLFEGGITTFIDLLKTGEPVRLTVSVAGASSPDELSENEIFGELLATTRSFKLVDDVLAGGNRIFTWTTSAI